MPEYDEEDITYLTGYLDGILRVCEMLVPGDRAFDEETWQQLYGSDIVYNTFPGYANDADARAGRTPFEMIEWDDDRDVFVLVDGAELPEDRSGELLFPDGTVVTHRDGERQMYSVPENVVAFIGSMRDFRLDVVRDVYDYDPDASD